MTLKHQLMDDFKAVMEDAEKLEKMLKELQDDVVDRTRAVAKEAREHVRERPWQSLGVTAALAALGGFLAGLLASRR